MISFKNSKMTGATAKMTGATSSSMHQMFTDYKTSMLEGLIDGISHMIGSDKINLNTLYREIYLMDTICGPTVDLMATLPWSEYDLIGIEDPKIREIYESSLQELDLINLMTQTSVSFQVLGQTIGSLIFNESKGIFTDVIIQDPDNCEIEDIPLRGYDPKIDLKVDKQMKKFLRSNDPRDVEARKEIPGNLLNKLLNGSKVALEPMSTLYISRSYVPGVKSISVYHRIIPFWLIEKALMRGTIIGAWRRQRSILHITVGDDNWDPTAKQLQEISSIFTNADQSAQGGVIATKQNISTNEVRNGSDFWKISDEIETLSSAKMKALGINEAFLSGESNYNTMEIALSVFMEKLRTERDFLTKSVLDNKIFLLLAKVHDFKKRTTAELTHRVRMTGSKNTSNINDYIIPKVKWRKQLKAVYDSQYVELLNSAKEKGVPIPLILFANAAGLSREELSSSWKEDVSFRKDIKAYNETLRKEGLAEAEKSAEVFSSQRFKNLEEKPIESEINLSTL